METLRYPRLPRPSSRLPSSRHNTPLLWPPSCRFKALLYRRALLRTISKPSVPSARRSIPLPHIPSLPPSLTSRRLQRRALCGGAPCRPEGALPTPSPLPRARPISARLPPALGQSAPASPPKMPPAWRGLDSRVPARQGSGGAPGALPGMGAGIGSRDRGSAASGARVALGPGACGC